MNEPTMDSLVKRLDRLEREGRLWKMLGISVVALGMFLLIGATQGEKIIIADMVKAKDFVLLGRDGTPVGFWGTGANNRPDLTFVDKEAHTLLKLTTTPVPMLQLGRGGEAVFSKRGISTSHLRVGNIHLDRSELRILSEDRKQLTKLSMFISPDGSASLGLYDNDGNKRAVLGSTSLETTDTGTEIKTAESSLVLFDKKGKVIWKAP